MAEDPRNIGAHSSRQLPHRRRRLQYSACLAASMDRSGHARQLQEVRGRRAASGHTGRLRLVAVNTFGTLPTLAKIQSWGLKCAVYQQRHSQAHEHGTSSTVARGGITDKHVACGMGQGSSQNLSVLCWYTQAQRTACAVLS